MGSVVSALYAAFAELDGAAMTACYHPAARFSDPVFELTGSDVGKMWRMLCAGASSAPWRLAVTEVVDDGATGSAHWEAWYTFSATGRPVHNVIDAAFVIEGDRIIEHRDHFSFWRWSRQALGPVGLLAGWSTPVKKRVRAQAAAGLASWR
jgi:hypothetical protein